MATPTLRLVRDSLPGCFIGGLVRPGLDEILAGSPFFDEMHIARSSGVMGPKFIAAKLRPRRYDTVLLLTNSFSTALIARIAGIPRRIGYDRDARGLLLTDRLKAPTTGSGAYAVTPAVVYYLRLACERLLGIPIPKWDSGKHPLELAITADEQSAADQIVRTAGLEPGIAYGILNPGGNNIAKRWSADRFAALAAHLVRGHGLHVLLNGSPGEADLLEQIRAGAPEEVRSRVISLAQHGITLGSLKGIVRQARLMVTNDTGPRHIAAALGVPLVSLFGPTDHRWTTIPTRTDAPEIILLADPTLPADQIANDHPDRCRIDRIELADVLAAADRILAGWKGPVCARDDWRNSADRPIWSEPTSAP